MTRRSSRAAGRKRRWIANLLLLAGIALVGVWAWSKLHTAIYEYFQNGKFERRKETENIPRPQEQQPPQRPPAPANGDVLGRLEVPRLHLRVIVREGVGEDILAVAAGHIPGTSLPGQKGNLAVAGHRDTLFRK